MECAKQMLDSSSYSIEEIADKCGFNGLTGFSRRFKQEFGISPSDYRKKKRSSLSELWHWKIPFDKNLLSHLFLLKKQNIWLTKFFNIIIDNFDNELFYIEGLANELFMSSSNLNRKVQGLFHFSIARIVRDLRLQYAAELLSIHNKSVTEAASLAGFFDAAHLSRYFKQTFGYLPSEYRNIEQIFSCIDKLKEESISKN